MKKLFIYSALMLTALFMVVKFLNMNSKNTSNNISRTTRNQESVTASETEAQQQIPEATTDTLEPASSLPLSLKNLPDGPFKESLEACLPAVQKYALNRTASLEIPSNDYPSLRVHPNGPLFYTCDFGGLPNDIHAKRHKPELDNIQSAALIENIQFTNSVSVTTPPVWHSRPGSTNILFLDFNGHVVTNTAWNSYPEYATASWDCRPYSIDGNDSTFSISEQQAMRIIYERVAEDYAPFDIDVTTEEPATWSRHTGHVLITPELDRNGVECPHFNAGGVAFVDVFGEPEYSYDFPGESYSPAWVLNYEFNGAAQYEAEAASHEMGHNLELSHDGTKTTAYYGGHENGDISWGPIMGAPYNMNVTQWSKGDYWHSNNKEDDLAILQQQLGYRADDHNSPSLNIISDTIQQTGIIETAADIDMFTFTISSGAVSIAASPYRDPSSTTWGGNADIIMELRDSNNTLISSNNQPLETSALISTTLPEGTYSLHIRTLGTGEPTQRNPTGYAPYGSLGQYSISGTVPVNRDLDGDGLPNTWEQAYFGSPTGTLAQLDFDGDGLDNYSEYIAGYNPTNKNSVFEISSEKDPQNETATFIITWTAIEGRIYTVQSTGNLDTEAFSFDSGDLPYPANAYTTTIQQTQSPRFYKLNVRLQ